MPSGQAVLPLDILWEGDAPGAPPGIVMRFLAPAIGTGAVDFDTAEDDLDHLCDTLVPPLVALTGPVGAITIALLDRPLARGVPDPEATMYIAGYVLEEGACRFDPL
ncbi:MAG: acetolactate synthase [Rhodobacteraceae bacterium]|nr:acetolactate synthase [Paracoccaceae bacterium]